MAEPSISIDLRNPGQVFACLGLMEAAEALRMTQVTGCFKFQDRDDKAEFVLASPSVETPLKQIFKFLKCAKVRVFRPATIDGAWPSYAEASMDMPAPAGEFLKSDGKGTTRNALPVELAEGDYRLPISSWLEGDGRKALKTFAGNQVGAKLISDLLIGPPNAFTVQSVLDKIDPDHPQKMFEEIGPVSGQFGFDARGAWDALRTGTSLEATKTHIAVSPLVELLAAAGLQSARPDFLGSYDLSYNVWRPALPAILARAALAPSSKVLHSGQFRTFLSHLGNDKHYKKCFFGLSEPS